MKDREMLERRAGAAQSGGNKLRETDVGRAEGKKEQGKGREETRILRRGKEEWKEVCERRGIRKGKRGVEKTRQKKKPLAPRAQRWWKMVKTDSRKCELALQGDENGLVKRCSKRRTRTDRPNRSRT